MAEESAGHIIKDSDHILLGTLRTPFWQRGSQPAEIFSKTVINQFKALNKQNSVFKTCQAMTARRGPSVSVINSIRGADECQHHSMVLMEPWGLCLTLASDTLWLPWLGLRDRVTKTSTPISHSSALQWDCCLALLRKEKNTAKRCGFRKPGSCLRGHQTQSCHSLIIISLRFADWARMCGFFFLLKMAAKQKVLWWLWLI